MPDLTITVNGKSVSVASGTSVAVAILIAAEVAFRRSVSGEPRGPLCGMGICYECRATINGERHARTCQIVCTSEMQVTTG